MIIGIDPSSKRLALVWKHPEARVATTPGVVTLELREKGESTYNPLVAWRAYDGLTELLRTLSDEPIVFLEEPVYSRSHQATIVQSFVSGAIQAAVLEHGGQIQLVNVMEWKKHLTRSGNASKTKVAESVLAYWPRLERFSHDQDVLDAAGILLYGRSLMQ